MLLSDGGALNRVIVSQSLARRLRARTGRRYGRATRPADRSIPDRGRGDAPADCGCVTGNPRLRWRVPFVGAVRRPQETRFHDHDQRLACRRVRLRRRCGRPLGPATAQAPSWRRSALGGSVANQRVATHRSAEQRRCATRDRHARSARSRRVVVRAGGAEVLRRRLAAQAAQRQRCPGHPRRAQRPFRTTAPTRTACGAGVRGAALLSRARSTRGESRAMLGRMRASRRGIARARTVAKTARSAEWSS